MRRRKFVASGLGLMAAAAGQGLVMSFNKMGLRAQPAVAPAAPRNPAGPPQGKWIRLAPFPQATGELLGATINGKLYAAQGCCPASSRPASCMNTILPATHGRRRSRCRIRSTTPPSRR